MSVFARLKKAREEKKGFTLVELIVVLVILAILAAILVPALLGWIDEASKKQYVLEARNIYVAAQAVADEGYLADSTSNAGTYLSAHIDRICELADIEDENTLKLGSVYTKGTKNFEIEAINFTFQSSSSSSTKTIGALLEDGQWTIDENGTLPDFKSHSTVGG